MRVKILNQADHEVDAEIREAGKIKLPSIQEGWRFNFAKHSKAKGASTFVLVTKETPQIIEGCLIYTMRNNTEPYLAYIEVAPHNRGEDQKFDFVAGCLIAYACRLSFIKGQGDYKGWLAFDVQEEEESDQLKLMSLYSSKYRAKRFEQTTTMVISPEDGEDLIGEYLK